MDAQLSVTNLQDHQSAGGNNLPPKDNNIVTASLYFGDLAPTVAESSL